MKGGGGEGMGRLAMTLAGNTLISALIGYIQVVYIYFMFMHVIYINMKYMYTT